MAMGPLLCGVFPVSSATTARSTHGYRAGD